MQPGAVGAALHVSVMGYGSAPPARQLSKTTLQTKRGKNLFRVSPPSRTNFEDPLAASLVCVRPGSDRCLQREGISGWMWRKPALGWWSPRDTRTDGRSVQIPSPVLSSVQLTSRGDAESKARCSLAAHSRVVLVSMLKSWSLVVHLAWTAVAMGIDGLRCHADAG